MSFIVVVYHSSLSESLSLPPSHHPHRHRLRRGSKQRKNALQKRKFVDVQKSGRGSSRGLFVDNMYRTIIINKKKTK